MGESDFIKLREVLKMTDLATMFIEEGRQEGRQDERVEIAGSVYNIAMK
jgi:ribosome-associated protein YbcJ (S4-like RNA binding protein)